MYGDFQKVLEHISRGAGIKMIESVRAPSVDQAGAPPAKSSVGLDPHAVTRWDLAVRAAVQEDLLLVLRELVEVVPAGCNVATFCGPKLSYCRR